MKPWLYATKSWLPFILLVFVMITSFYLLQEREDRISCKRYNAIAQSANDRLAFIEKVYPLLQFKSHEDEVQAAKLLAEQGLPTFQICEGN